MFYMTKEIKINHPFYKSKCMYKNNFLNKHQYLLMTLILFVLCESDSATYILPLGANAIL